MNKVIIRSHNEFTKFIGKQLGISEYIQITQEQINKFADATMDQQWIHVDPERAQKDSPYKKTIAHGYLSLSILSYFWNQIFELQNVKLMVNYGIERLRFKQPVIVNSRVRARVKLHSLVDLRGISKAKLECIMEIENSNKPAFEAIIVVLYDFNN